MRMAAGLAIRRPVGPRRATPAFEHQPASRPLPLPRALAERFPAHIEGGRFAPLLHRISSDAGARYALTDAWDSSRPGAPMADTWALTLGPKADAWRPAFRA